VDQRASRIIPNGLPVIGYISLILFNTALKIGNFVQVLSGPECQTLFLKSTLRRGFHSYDEMYCASGELVYFIDNLMWTQLKAAMMLQRKYRAKHCKPIPLRWFFQWSVDGVNCDTRDSEWSCLAFTFDVPQEAYEEMIDRCGWAFLRRRSLSIGYTIIKYGA